MPRVVATVITHGRFCPLFCKTVVLTKDCADMAEASRERMAMLERLARVKAKVDFSCEIRENAS